MFNRKWDARASGRLQLDGQLRQSSGPVECAAISFQEEKNTRDVSLLFLLCSTEQGSSFFEVKKSTRISFWAHEIQDLHRNPLRSRNLAGNMTQVPDSLCGKVCTTLKQTGEGGLSATDT